MHLRIDKDICHLSRSLWCPDQDPGANNQNPHSKICCAEQRLAMPAVGNSSSICLRWLVRPHRASSRNDGIQHIVINQRHVLIHLHSVFAWLSTWERQNWRTLEFCAEELSLQQNGRKAPALGDLEDSDRTASEECCWPLLRAFVFHAAFESSQRRAYGVQS